jgi:hypothetical protein
VTLKKSEGEIHLQKLDKFESRAGQLKMQEKEIKDKNLYLEKVTAEMDREIEDMKE